MGFFGSKKDKADRPAGKKSAGKKTDREVQASGTPAMKKSEMLSTVLDESVDGAALDIMRENVPFKLRMRGGENYVVTVLRVADIGGLNKHMKNDPDKGQFIECINAGNIDIYVDSEGLTEGYFYIIPSEKTLASLEEFSFLSDPDRFSSFLPALVSVSDGEMDFTVFGSYTVDYDWMVSVSQGGVSIDDEVARFEGRSVSAPEDDDDDYEDDDRDDYEDVQDNDMAYADEDGMDDAYSDDDDMPPDDEQPSQPVQQTPVQMFSGDEDLPTGEENDTEGEGIQEDVDALDEDINITDGQINDTIERLFHADDLRLPITSDPFDLQFVKENQFIPINEDRGDGWLDMHVTQMVKNANAMLYQLHMTNLSVARRRYLQIIESQCETIAAKVDVKSPDTPYHEALNRIIEEHNRQRHEMEDAAEKKRLELQTRWENELEEVQQAAAAAAKRDYIDKFHKTHETALRDVETSISDAIDTDYDNAKRELNERRRTEAHHLLDIAISQTLLVMEGNYRTLLDEEDKAKASVLDTIQTYIDEHRKEDVARAQLQKQELDANTAIETAIREADRKVADITNHYESICDKLHQEIDAAQKHSENIRLDFNDRVNIERDRNTENERRYNELNQKYADLHTELEDKMASEYGDRLSRLEHEKESLEAEFEYVNKLRDRSSRVSIAVWIAVAVATFCIGCIAGSKMFTAEPKDDKNHLNISVTAQQEPVSETDDAQAE